MEALNIDLTKLQQAVSIITSISTAIFVGLGYRLAVKRWGKDSIELEEKALERKEKREKDRLDKLFNSLDVYGKKGQAFPTDVLMNCLIQGYSQEEIRVAANKVWEFTMEKSPLQRASMMVKLDNELRSFPESVNKKDSN